MTVTMQGIAAVLNDPMRGRPLVLGQPDPLWFTSETPVYFGDRRAGEVTRLWLEGALVHWKGVLDDEPPALTWAGDQVTVAVPEPSPAVLIAAGALVGIPAFVSGRTEQRDGVTVISPWSLARMDLVRARPWPEVTLRLTDDRETAGARAGAV